MRMLRGLVWTCAVGLGACAAMPSDPGGGNAPPAAATAALAGSRWIGVVAGESDPRILPRLEFVREGRLSGFTGCNMFSGVWKLEGASVRVGTLSMTKRLCLGPAGEVEKRLLAALGEGARGRREGERLVFTGAGGARFEFKEAAAT